MFGTCRPLLVSPILLVAALVVGCGPSTEGEVIITKHETFQKEQKAEDDRIEDKKPVFDPSLTVVEFFDSCQVTLNKSGSVTKLDIAPFADADGALDGTLYATRAEALAALTTVTTGDVIPSMEVVNGVSKHFNDGLYAAIELCMQGGVDGEIKGKREFIEELAAALVDALGDAKDETRTYLEQGIVHLGTALSLGGGVLDGLPAGLRATAEEQASKFTESALGDSRPVGFYTWSDELGEVFRQDRFLQNQANPGLASLSGQFGMFAAMAAVLEQNPDLTKTYERLLSVYGGLTNSFVAYPLTSFFAHVDGLDSLDDPSALQATFLEANPVRFPCSDGYPYAAVLPASASKDTRFYNDTYCYQSVPEGTTFIDAFINAIRAGSLDLSPDASSGWYDYQLHALETLLLPERGRESDHLLLTASYKKKLLDSFKTIITQTRETHVKQLQKGATPTSVAPPKVDVYPLFQVEPFPTFYLRIARAYRFLGTYLEAVLGPELMSQLERHPGERNKPARIALAADLDAITNRFYGFYVLSARSVGLDPNAQLLEDELVEIDLDAAVEAAESWLGGWREDGDVKADGRVIVPVATDAKTGKVVYWAVIGVKVVKFKAEFVEGFEPKVEAGFCEVKGFVSHGYYLLVEDMVEVRISDDAAPLTRDELRDLCDKHGDKEAIIQALQEL